MSAAMSEPTEPVDPAPAAPSEEFDDAYPQLYRVAYRVAYRLTGAREEARDIAQEACVRAYARWSRVCRNDSPTGWVAHIAGNLAIDVWRRQQTASRHAHREVPHREHDHDARVDLHAALARLSRRQREVVVLRFVADLPEAAVAAALACSVGTVKTHAARGLAALRVDLAQEEQ